MRKIIFINRKGGSGKTTIAVNIAYNLSKKGIKVLALDLDSQAHTSFYLKQDLMIENLDVSDLINEDVNIDEVILRSSYRNLDIIPSSQKVSEVNLLINEDLMFLSRRIEEIESKKKYDYLLIDVPPSMENIVLSGLIAAQEVIIPLQTHFFAMQGIAQLIKLLIELNRKYKSDINLAGIVPTLYNKRTRIYKKVVEEVSDTFGEDLILTGIPYDIKLAEAPGFREPVSLYAGDSRAAHAFKKLCIEIERMSQKGE
jgi:chromosome partitioning protein